MKRSTASLMEFARPPAPSEGPENRFSAIMGWLRQHARLASRERCFPGFSDPLMPGSGKGRQRAGKLRETPQGLGRERKTRRAVLNLKGECRQSTPDSAAERVRQPERQGDREREERRAKREREKGRQRSQREKNRQRERRKIESMCEKEKARVREQMGETERESGGGEQEQKEK